MKTVNAVSGGKTSSYMAVHYPADYNVFSLVCIEDHSCAPKDKKLVQLVSDKIGFEFIATLENDKTLRVMLDLEQLLGTEVTWLAGASFDSIIAKKVGLPNKQMRWCTIKMKLETMFWWWYLNLGEVVEKRVGFRWDESERAANHIPFFEFPKSCNTYGQRQQRWETIEWEKPAYPLIDNKIVHGHVVEWSRKTRLVFPEDSNCVSCFWKPEAQLRKNWDDYPEKMEWAARQERTRKYTWKEGVTYDQIRQQGLQLDFPFGPGLGCKADGYCID